MADMIKKQYLGGEKLKKKMLKPSEKFKFNFDWEAGDDTSKDLNPLYNNTHQAQLLFGRGLRAGVDRREQKKVSKPSRLSLSAGPAVRLSYLSVCNSTVNCCRWFAPEVGCPSEVSWHHQASQCVCKL